MTFSTESNDTRLEGFYTDKQDLLNQIYQMIVEIRNVYLQINSDLEYLNKNVDTFIVNYGNTSAMNKLDKAGELLALANSYYSMAKYICELNSNLHPMADEILSEDVSSAFLKQNYMMISNTIQFNCIDAKETIVKRTEVVAHKAQELYSSVLDEYNKEYSL